MVQAFKICEIYYSFSKSEEVPIELGSINYFFGMLKNKIPFIYPHHFPSLI